MRKAGAGGACDGTAGEQWRQPQPANQRRRSADSLVWAEVVGQDDVHTSGALDQRRGGGRVHLAHRVTEAACRRAMAFRGNMSSVKREASMREQLYAVRCTHRSR